MFKFLKDKLKGAISRISKSVEEEKPVEETAEEPKEEKITESKGQAIEEESIIKEPAEKEPESIPEIGKTKERTGEEKDEELEKELEELEREQIPKETTEEQIEDVREETKKELIEEKEKIIEEKLPEKEEVQGKQETKEKKGFFSRFREKITTTKISREKFENLFSELELIMMENNVAMEVIDKIKSDLSNDIVEKPIKRTGIEAVIKESLKKSIEDLFDVDKISLLAAIKGKEDKPFVIAFFGINGSGKTTSIAKIANMLKQNKLSVVLAAADTFRAASIEQLQQHTDKLGVRMIKHDYGSDPAAVAFDAIKHAKSKNADVVLIDTAGRLHSQQNLMQEMEKIIRISKPDLKIFVGESITGNDCVEQAKSFNDAVGIDGLILTKADVDEKGGAAISVSYITKKPIMYLGIGQEYNDLKEFDPDIVVEGLGLA